MCVHAPIRITAFASAALAALLSGAGAALADIAVRFPEGATPEEEAAVVAAVEAAQGAEARAFRADARAAPEPAPPAVSLEALERARRAYKALELDAAAAALGEAEAACTAGGSCEACRDLLFDTHLLRGAVALASGRDAEGAEEFVVAHAVQAARVVDPRRFPPRIVNAFNRACAEAAAEAPVAVRLSSEPSGAAFRVNGAAAGGGADVLLRSPRAYVEARLVGHAPRCEPVEVAPGGGFGHVVRLAAIGEGELPGEAERFFAQRDPAIDPAAFAFLARLGIDRLLFLSTAPPPNRFTARATHAKASVWTALPALASAAAAASPGFSGALALAVGADRAAGPAPAAAPPGPPAATAPGGLEDEDEEGDGEEMPAAPPEGGEPGGSSVLRSPWLWISVGIVVAVVAGVVIGTQAGGD